MYARFLTKALADLGELDVQEPFANLFAQGMVTRDGAKMSKSRGNTVSPGDYVERFGADTARAYICFMGPPERGGDWSDEGVEGVNRFLARLWRLCEEVESKEAGEVDAQGRHRRGPRPARQGPLGDRQGHPRLPARLPVQHRDRGRDGAGQRRLPAQGRPIRRATGVAAVRFAAASAASLIFPFAPHLGAEAWERLNGGRVWEQPWPVADPAMLVSDTVTLIVQVNGRLRDRIEARSDASRDELLRLARESEKVSRHIDGREVVKEVVVPGKLVNFVVG